MSNDDQDSTSSKKVQQEPPELEIQYLQSRLECYCQCYSISQLGFVFSEYVCGPWPDSDLSDWEGPGVNIFEGAIKGATPIFN